MMYKNYESMTMEELKNEMTESKFFEIDESVSPSLYQKEKYRMIEMIFVYGNRLWNGKNIVSNSPEESYSIELWELAERCLQFYDLEGVPFVTYLNGALYREKQWIDIRKHEEEKRFADDIVTTEDGEKLSLLDLQASAVDVEKTFCDVAAVVVLFRIINEAFLEAMEKSRPVLSALLTNEIMECVRETELLEAVAGFDFFDMKMAEKVYENGKGFSQMEIGGMFGKSDANISAIFGRFKEKIRMKKMCCER